PDRAGVPGQAGEGGPRVGGTRPGGPAHVEVVVRPEERPEPEPLGLEGHGQEVVVGGTLLGFGEDPELHGTAPYPRAAPPTGEVASGPATPGVGWRWDPPRRHRRGSWSRCRRPSSFAAHRRRRSWRSWCPRPPGA